MNILRSILVRSGRAIHAFIHTPPPPPPPGPVASEEEATALVPERGTPIGSLLLLFYPRAATGLDVLAGEEGVGVRIGREQVILMDPRIPPGWTGEALAEYLERLAQSFREDDFLDSDQVEELSK